MTQVATDTGTGTAVAVYPDHGEADTAVKALQHGGFDMRKLSIVSRRRWPDDAVAGPKIGVPPAKTKAGGGH